MKKSIQTTVTITSEYLPLIKFLQENGVNMSFEYRKLIKTLYSIKKLESTNE
jgi:hypothetical protein